MAFREVTVPVTVSLPEGVEPTGEYRIPVASDHGWVNCTDPRNMIAPYSVEVNCGTLPRTPRLIVKRAAPKQPRLKWPSFVPQGWWIAVTAKGLWHAWPIEPFEHVDGCFSDGMFHSDVIRLSNLTFDRPALPENHPPYKWAGPEVPGCDLDLLEDDPFQLERLKRAGERLRSYDCEEPHVGAALADAVKYFSGRLDESDEVVRGDGNPLHEPVEKEPEWPWFIDRRCCIVGKSYETREMLVMNGDPGEKMADGRWNADVVHSTIVTYNATMLDHETVHRIHTGEKWLGPDCIHATKEPPQ
ncbi:hypothetical protein [Kordiimonas sp.]|uniref:hypothetical protein n=1 Tax=Kordiimonas sp. TaxID=1970157 RepID=UPI003A8FEC58